MLAVDAFSKKGISNSLYNLSQVPFPTAALERGLVVQKEIGDREQREKSLVFVSSECAICWYIFQIVLEMGDKSKLAMTKCL